MERRTFITLLGGATTWPFAVRAQQPTMPVIGWLHGSSAEQGAGYSAASRKGLSETGYVEGSAALEIFAAHLKKSFATQSGVKRKLDFRAVRSAFDPEPNSTIVARGSTH